MGLYHKTVSKPNSENRLKLRKRFFNRLGILLKTQTRALVSPASTQSAPLTIDELQPWMNLEAGSISFLLCHRRSLKLDSSDSFSAIDELHSIYSSTTGLFNSLINTRAAVLIAVVPNSDSIGTKAKISPSSQRIEIDPDITMDLTPFKKDIDELIAEFAEGESTTLVEIKRAWLSRKFSYIYEASPSSNLAFFMQSLYAHSIGYMSSTASLSCRLGGLYCLYCLHETQPFKPPFKIYLSLEELKKLRNLVVTAKEKGLKVVPALVKRMLEKNMFLLGFLDMNEGAVAETVNQLTELQNARVQVACKELFADTRLQDLLHLDMGKEIDLHALKKISTEYAEAKKLAISEASAVVDVHNIEHIAEDEKSVGNVVEKISREWDVEREQFCQQTGLGRRQREHHEQQEQPLLLENEEFDLELEQLLSET
ncbi:Small nuclear RNA activating complex (SNAPc), subunit SNAP [Parasponia andersonii]|uniref:Small nuclear RNA activating complex (SNAPc), subunit SNAP n=1 Tax=Parasponia andersonii TaxID=3476 RepID=A0A2P5DUU9_PARAD|nr:Small nuclear RNA activating complex (SNAPc), subunit SNAP [Parasponia andersonii]